GGQYPFGSYDYNQTLPPMISSGALDYALRASDAQFQQDLEQTSHPMLLI
ncbi:unnamed protein product, partial [Rotaria sp. Silwood1]